MRDVILNGYNEDAEKGLIDAFEAIDVTQYYSPIADLIPKETARILDIGAGTGRDAAWFAKLGHLVTAIEPATKLMAAAKMLHSGLGIEWRNDTLPLLEGLKRNSQFDLILLSAVWQHINDNERQIAMSRIGQLITKGGVVIMSLRHGIGAPNRPVFAVDVDETINIAALENLKLIRRFDAASVQEANIKNNVHWTWLVFKAGLTFEENL